MANRTAPQCSHGHPTPTAADRTAQGFCRTCKRLDDLRRQKRNTEAGRLVRALEAMTPAELAELLAAP
jgi:hypothetical protein